MRVICLVPSLTETLLECGVNVVGRTRFCIHPAEQVKSIASVGGTKKVDWLKCAGLKPDLVVFDKEENPRQMAEDCPFDWYATHIVSVDNIGPELQKLANNLGSTALAEFAEQWQTLTKPASLRSIDWNNVPGQTETLANTRSSYAAIEYIIWRDPWMAVSPQTFIGSMLKTMGFGDLLRPHTTPYPQLNDEQMADDYTFYLFSSEPYPFCRHKTALLDAGFNGAIVDGEVYSWFGVRSYRALDNYLKMRN